jgi:zinc transport system substrate-binding protein
MQALYPIVIFLLFSNQVFSATKSNIVATIRPIQSLVQNIVGNTNEVGLIVNTNSVHNFHIKVSDVQKIKKAQVLFYIDNSMEVFLKKIPTLAPNTKMISIATPDMTILTNHKSRLHSHHNKNWHLWLSVENAKKIINKITKTLVKEFPKNKEIYEKNYKKTLKKLELLKIKIQTQMQVKHKPYIVLHNAYMYFEKENNIHNEAVIMNHSKAQLSINQFRQINNTIKNKKVGCIFNEPHFKSSKIITNLHANKNTKYLSLDPLGMKFKLGKNLYFKILENMSSTFSNCFK